MELLGIFVAWPFLALIPALIFAWLFIAMRRLGVLVASVAWLAYFAYEEAVKLRILCSGECNIRVDLLLFYPILAFISALALYAYIRAIRARRYGYGGHARSDRG
jgi:hypothetical protein